MSLTATQIVVDACGIAKCPGMISLGGRTLNLVLQDLVLHHDLKVNLVSTTIAVSIGSPGPFSLVVNYLRTYDLFYLIQGDPRFLMPATRKQYDQDSNPANNSTYPQEYATDLSPPAVDGTPGLLYIYPTSNQTLSLTHRYFLKRDDITSPQTSAVVPWFSDQDYLITATAMRLMRTTDDARYAEFVANADKLLDQHLLKQGDEQEIVKEVRLDPRRFRFKANLRSTKIDPF